MGVQRKETLILSQEIRKGFTEMVCWSCLLDESAPRTDQEGHSKQQGCEQ